MPRTKGNQEGFYPNGIQSLDFLRGRFTRYFVVEGVIAGPKPGKISGPNMRECAVASGGPPRGPRGRACLAKRGSAAAIDCPKTSRHNCRPESTTLARSFNLTKRSPPP